MTKTVLNIKTDVEVKREAQKLAKEIGVPLSTIVNVQLKKFIADRELTIRAPLVPTPYLEKVLARAQKTTIKDYSPLFSNTKDARKWLLGGK
jgi:antitoxin component of RelBE/YafQ-DinJ toxin-antitoxin module